MKLASFEIVKSKIGALCPFQIFSHFPVLTMKRRNIFLKPNLTFKEFYLASHKRIHLSNDDVKTKGC